MLVLRGLFILAQAPQQFSFQGVARKADGQVAANATISVRTTVHSETAGGTTVYQETHTSQTNTIGIFNIQIGGGTVVSGKFADISWKTFPYFLQLEMDPLGGTTYSDLGTTQMLSVPYAIQAAEATKWNDGFPVVQKDGFGPDIDPNDPDVLNDPDAKKYFLPIIGDGNRLIWYPLKGAFRAGESLGGKWEEPKIGTKSVAFGGNTEATGDFGFAMGLVSSASGLLSTAFGQNAVASGSNSVAIGLDVNASGPSSTAFGIGVLSRFRGQFAAGMFNDSPDVADPASMKPTDIVFQIGNGTANNDRKSGLTMLRNGNLGVGGNVVTPEFPLDVGGRMRIKHNGATSGIYFNNSQNVADGFMGMKTDAQIGFFINGAWRFYVDNAGNGALGGTLTQFSDRRLKRDFSSLSASLRKLAGLKGYHYYWKDQDKDQSLQTGLIAQEVEVLFPELVKTDDKGFKSLNYTGLIPHLIESVKQLAHQNAKLEAENAAFKADSKDIHDQLTMIESRLDKILVQPSGITAR
ncbi:hypothetical protein GCM10007423_62440 [Dyadobacter endophyticus]|uniref:Peptidase S74 domain-containing protein n=2 Tax=Dyadobacter endophyticus TaxID=1749036 RepID=A0ABQ1ZA28_9BACT|nr:hypothetical protein GCM10007423_62440 [Dyadobacter endophyticus]